MEKEKLKMEWGKSSPSSYIGYMSSTDSCKPTVGFTD